LIGTMTAYQLGDLSKLEKIMVDVEIKKLILGVIGQHLDELDDAEITVDGDFLDDLGLVLETEGIKQGLDPALAARIRQLASVDAADELGFAQTAWPSGQGGPSEGARPPLVH
jgi:hypothetical protein